MKIKTHTTWTLEADDYEIGMIITALGALEYSILGGSEPKGLYELQAIRALRAQLDSRR